MLDWRDVSGPGQHLLQLRMERSPDNAIGEFEIPIVCQTGVEQPQAKRYTLTQHSSLVCASHPTLDPSAGVIHIWAIGRENAMTSDSYSVPTMNY